MADILIADNASIVQFVLERILGKEGYAVHYTRYPRDLVQMVPTLKPCLIFLEAEIGGGRGYRICEYLARRPETRQIPIVLTTRVTELKACDFESWPGVVRVLRKPLSSQQVLEAVQAHAMRKCDHGGGAHSQVV